MCKADAAMRSFRAELRIGSGRRNRGPKHRSWPVAAIDVIWGAFVTAVSSTAGLLIANRRAPKI
jgi:hypothetical protein